MADRIAYRRADVTADRAAALRSGPFAGRCAGRPTDRIHSREADGAAASGQKFGQKLGRKLGLAFGLVLGLSLGAVPASAQEIKGDAKAAEGKVAMCIGCHGIGGYKASFPEVYSVPMIAGQSGKYIEAALNAYRKGDRAHPTMQAIAGGLSDQDIADLAAYYAAKK